MTDPSQFWIQLLTNPKTFFKSHLHENKIEHFNIAIAVFCLGYGIDRLEKQLVKLELRGTLDSFEFINTWSGFWLLAIVGGAIGGYILYLIGGWFYNVRVKWSRGTGNLEKSRNLYLFSNFYLYLIIILDTIFETILFPIPYDPYSEFGVFELISIPILLFFIFYSIYISYSGVTSVTDVNRGRAQIWFMILPIFFYIVAFSTLIIVMFNHFVN